MTGQPDRRSGNRVRAVHEVDADVEACCHEGIVARWLESNVVAVEIAR